MIDSKHTSGRMALRAALAILKQAGGPGRWGGGARPVTAGELAGTIQAELDRTGLRTAVEAAMKEILYWHRDALIEGEGDRSRDAGWARAYAGLAAARDLLRGRGA